MGKKFGGDDGDNFDEEGGNNNDGTDDYKMDARSEDSYKLDDDEDFDESDNEGRGKKRNKRGGPTSGAKPKRTQKSKKWENAFDANGNDLEEKKEKKKRVPKPKVV